MSDDDGLTPPPRKRAPRKAPAKKAPAKKATPKAQRHLHTVEDEPVADISTLPPQDAAGTAVALVEVLDPAVEAHKMRLAGSSWADAAEANGYASVHSAVVAVNTMLSRAAQEVSRHAREHALLMQRERYDAILRAWYPKATNPITPDKDAAVLVIQALRDISKLERLDQPTEDTSAGRVVVYGSREEYLASLQAAVVAQSGNGNQSQ